MAANVRFVAEADVSAVLRADQKVQESQKLSERGFQRVGDAGVKASERTAAALKKEAQAIELVDLAETRRVRTRGSSAGVYAGRSGPPITLAPLPATSAATLAGGSSSIIRLARTDDEQFQRYLKAEGIRAGRATTRLNAADDALFSDFVDTEHKRRRWAREAMVRRGREGQQNLRDAGLYAGGAALAAGGYAVGESVQSLEQARGRNVEFTDDFRKIATLGGNIDNIVGKRNQVLAFSNAWGVASEKITAAMYSIESAASNLSEGEKGQVLTGAMQFNRMQGADPELSGKAILKYKEIWGTSVNESKNRIFRTADIGDVDIDKIASFGPDYWAKAKAAGFNDLDADALIAVATQKLGRTEKTFTGTGDVLQKVFRVGKKLGVDLHRDPSFLDQLAPLMGTQAGRDLLSDESMFGTDVGVVQALFQSRGELPRNKSTIGQTGDPVAANLRKMWKDPSMNFAERTAIYGQLERNAPLSGSYIQDFGQTDLDFQAREIGMRQQLPEYLSWLRKPLAWGETVIQEADKKSRWLGAGLRALNPLVQTRDALVHATGLKDPLKDFGNAAVDASLHQAGRTDLAADTFEKAAEKFDQAVTRFLGGRGRNDHN